MSTENKNGYCQCPRCEYPIAIGGFEPRILEYINVSETKDFLMRLVLLYINSEDNEIDGYEERIEKTSLLTNLVELLDQVRGYQFQKELGHQDN